ncbi:MAG TPA: serine/threonine-protein kinase [Patescibacteria group bacterium]|nr:serine/threonine-protein kinase [Patescibacteria group bacterium]
MTGARPPSPDAPLEPDPMIGRVLADRYRLDSLVARGGMARVYRAHDDRLDRMVAVKVLAPPYSDDPAFTDRFLGEARAAASLSHPSLVHVYDSGSDGAAHFIVMELLDRHRTLRDILQDRGRLPAGEAIRIGRELLAGLRVVHEHGLVHCDVKAANVMLGPGPAKLIDFGIAQPPHQGLEGESSIGTLQSMSPEQLHGDPLTPASDLFSLGVVLFQALTGRMPYAGTTPEEVSAAHAAQSVAPPSSIVPDLPPRLDAVVLQSLRRDPAGRFHSAVAMSRALEVVAADATGSDDETRVVRTTAATAAPGPAAGYVPPPVPDRPPAPASAPAPRPTPRRRGHPPQPAGRRRGWSTIGMLAMLAAAALVVALVAVPLLGLGGGGSGDLPSAAPSESAAPTTVAPDVIPATIGLPTDQAIALASQVGLNWTVRCNHDESQPEGIIDQEPAAGTEVAPGSRFTMFSARIDDCRGGDDGSNRGGNGGNNGRGNDD